MEVSLIYNKLKQHFPNQIENINSNVLDVPQFLNFAISANLPHLPLQQLHSMCKLQQKNITERIKEVKHHDLYDQIAKVCPQQRDLRYLNSEQINKNISIYTSKMVLTEKNEEIEEDNMGDIQEMDSLVMEQDNRGMRNIMEQQQQRFAWNYQGYYYEYN